MVEESCFDGQPLQALEVADLLKEQQRAYDVVDWHLRKC